MKTGLSTIEEYELVGMIILVALAIIPFLLTIMAFLDRARVRLMRVPPRTRLRRLALTANVILILCLIDGFLIEPNLLTVTRVNARSSAVSSHTGELRIVHISDLHFEKDGPLMRKVLRTVAAQMPDIIVNTGDTCQYGPTDEKQFHEFYARLCEIAPTYHIAGDPSVAQSGGHGTSAWEGPRVLDVRGTRIEILGVRGTVIPSDAPLEKDGLRLVLGHMPGFYTEAERLNADWYFCGHTHGGQVRIPLWGAVITNSHTGKRFEYGRYRVGEMDMFVSRGIGFEPRPAPQVRFLCPPEIVVLTLSP